MRAYEYQSGSPVQARSESYTYDSHFDRLTAAQYTDWTLGDPMTSSESWTCDVMGNRSNSGQTWSYDGLNRLTSRPSVSYTHDLVGNRLEEDVAGGTQYDAAYAWDDTNRLVSRTQSSTQHEYLYRADGMRLQSLKKVAGNQDKRTEYLYDGQMSRLASSEWLIVDGRGNRARCVPTEDTLSGFQW